MIESLIWHIHNFIDSDKSFFVPMSILVSFIFSVILILISMPLLREFGVVDVPDSRRAHTKPTIRGGGIALVISYIIAFSFIEFFSEEQIALSKIFIPLIIITVISFTDDVKEVKIFYRLSAHIISSYLCIKYLLADNLIFRGEVHPNIDTLLTVFALTAFINIYNFLDGIDGISAMQSIHLSLTTLFLCIIRDKVILNIDFVFYSSAILLGISIGFLFFNWSPAKIFLGDVGSTFLGILHGVNLLIIASSSERLFLAAVISSLYYIADGGITLLTRIINGEKFWLPHLKHFFQIAVKGGMSHKEVVLKISSLNFLLLIFSIMSLYLPHISIIMSILSVTFLLIHFKNAKLSS